MSNSKENLTSALTYDVWISGNKLGMDKKQCISSIEIKETVEGSDLATIVIADPEYLFIEDNIFIEKNTIIIKMGFTSTTYRVEFKGYISAVDIDFGADGIPVLQITCMDRTYKMNRSKKNKTYKKKTTAQIVKSIVKKYGFKYKGDKNYKFHKQDSVSQSDQSDIEFIMNLAQGEVYPFTARLVGDTFYYQKMGKMADTPKYTLVYRNYPHDIITFSPKINTETIDKDTSSSKTTTKNKTSSTSKTKGKSNKGSSSSSGKGKSSKNTYTYNPKNKSWKKN